MSRRLEHSLAEVAGSLFKILWSLIPYYRKTTFRFLRTTSATCRHEKNHGSATDRLAVSLLKKYGTTGTRSHVCFVLVLSQSSPWEGDDSFTNKIHDDWFPIRFSHDIHAGLDGWFINFLRKMDASVGLSSSLVGCHIFNWMRTACPAIMSAIVCNSAPFFNRLILKIGCSTLDSRLRICCERPVPFSWSDSQP